MTADFAARHAAAEARGRDARGTPTAQACAEVREWQRRRADDLTTQLALSALEAGIANIKRGKVKLGAAGVAVGLSYLGKVIEGVES